MSDTPKPLTAGQRDTVESVSDQLQQVADELGLALVPNRLPEGHLWEGVYTLAESIVDADYSPSPRQCRMLARGVMALIDERVAGRAALRELVYWKCKTCGHRWDRSDDKRPWRCPKCEARLGLCKTGRASVSILNVTIGGDDAE